MIPSTIKASNQLVFTPAQVALIRRTVAKDANENEFNLYIEMCKARGLNPLLRHCYCFIFHKDNAAKRQMVIVVSIDGQRHIAERTGAYRPDERPPRFAIDESLKNKDTNPLGLESAVVTVYKHSHGSWHPIHGIAYWDERAPLKEIWEGGKPTGRYALDPKKDGWRKMPRLMLAKVAEMDALRRAFPDDFGGLYGEEEMDKGEILDLTPSEMAERSEQEDRLQKIGGAGCLTVDWLNDTALEPIPSGQFFDRVAAHIRTLDDKGTKAWEDRNRHALREFWALHGDDALELKKLIEKKYLTRN